MGDYSSVPKRTPEAGDEVFGWDDSAGEEAFFPIGSSPGDIPLGSTLQNGRTLGTVDSAGRQIRIDGFVVPGGNHRYLRLIDLSLNDQSVNLGIGSATTGGGAAEASALRAVLGHSTTLGKTSGFVLTAGTVPFSAKLVTFDHAGKTWLGLDFNPSVGSFGLVPMVLYGVVSSQFVLASVLMVASADVSVVADFVSDDVPQFSGFPGAAIGQNQSLHISGSPGTSKEVMVDGNGFIVEV
ncbi:hypothetical protein [Algiphilus sp.]|uniref:hypothetical protein n=1 Tax=Algiphilus sp. TaxID=1872431 RepID=UPI0025BB9E5F|nr:hypothetical protein [Algiphilus sp.]MCK5769462.1 hypothetical protein [Algiphilus sp.]